MGSYLAAGCTVLCLRYFLDAAIFHGITGCLVEAARIDGASSMRILRSVLLPIAWPPVLTLATLMFIWSWNEFLLSLVVLDRGTRTAPAGLGIFTGQWVSDIPALSAAAIIIALPTILLYVLLNRRIISGILQGAVKVDAGRDEK